VSVTERSNPHESAAIFEHAHANTSAA